MGNDTLSGGDGQDTFAFTTAIAGGTNVDTIADFDAAQDTIRLDHTVFAGLDVLAQLSATQFALDTAIGTGPQIVYNQTTGRLDFDSNGADPGGATQFATVSGAPTLTTANFTVV